MQDIDVSGPDRQIGSLLSGEEVERLRARGYAALELFLQRLAQHVIIVHQ